ncbi:alpha/beta fold hydrolase [Arthrobacter sp. AL12]|uniref:alpha/beta fold hydrolase n=1 Tax=Arthrobacter sp. AL12 TaxID=3042241 RepID=UPI00249CABED|nr:alpha/beta fold hydrolase [Arthrobacter sp. AL12]MDI3213466.1 alpha/beta fold hydrolase [Arthrobacter sp. AL12]
MAITTEALQLPVLCVTLGSRFPVPERVELDQRGCGKSTPLVQDNLDRLSENTTQALIEDIEAVREHPGIEKWIVIGVSRGSTLALAYALEHPNRVLGIALVAVTTSSREEIQWITDDVGRIFPEEWTDFSEAANTAPRSERAER